MSLEDDPFDQEIFKSELLKYSRIEGQYLYSEDSVEMLHILYKRMSAISMNRKRKSGSNSHYGDDEYEFRTDKLKSESYLSVQFWS